jgi:dolichol-phosphate mannosyltransferase
LHGLLERLQVHPGDLRDGAFVAAAVAAARPRLVYHLATYGAYERQGEATPILETNILGTHHLLQACEHHGVELFIATGSSSEYGFKSTAMRETDLLEPNSFYAIAKSAETHLCQLQARRGKLATVVFRLFSVYGPWEDPQRLIPTVMRRARAGLPLELVSPAVARDFVYVDDVLAAMMNVAPLQQLRGEVFNLCTGIETSLEEVARGVLDLLSSASELRWGAMQPRSWDTNHWVGDTAKARQRLGWSAQVPLREGLGRMAAWMQQQGDNYGPAAQLSL